MEKLKINEPILVEGKYDKITLSSVLDAHIIPLGGFSIFNQKEKADLLRRLTENGKVIVLTDADGAGKLIRSHLSSILPKDKVIHLYTPSIEGKEGRKKTPSKAGLLGVEGMEAEELRRIFSPFAAANEEKKEKGRAIEKRDFYADGLSGGAGAKEKREALAAYFRLPKDMTANALMEALNLLYDYPAYQAAIAKIAAKENG